MKDARKIKNPTKNWEREREREWERERERERTFLLWGKTMHKKEDIVTNL